MAKSEKLVWTKKPLLNLFQEQNPRFKQKESENIKKKNCEKLTKREEGEKKILLITQKKKK